MAIIDWESGGWHSEFWECTRLSRCWFLEPVFWDLLQFHLVTYPDELAGDIALGAVFLSHSKHLPLYHARTNIRPEHMAVDAHGTIQVCGGRTKLEPCR